MAPIETGYFSAPYLFWKPEYLSQPHSVELFPGSPAPESRIPPRHDLSAITTGQGPNIIAAKM